MAEAFANPFGATPAPGAGPGAPKAVMGAFQLPADPSWEPIESTDFLELNGYYCARITAEKPVEKGVWLTLEIQDPDAAGKKIQTMLDDVSVDPKGTWKWRGLILSITGNKAAAQQPIAYNPGANLMVGQLVYLKTQSFETKGNLRTGMETWITKTDWEAAAKGGKHRWKAEVKNAPTGGFGTPGGLPGGFPVPMPPAANPISMGAGAAAVQVASGRAIEAVGTAAPFTPASPGVPSTASQPTPPPAPVPAPAANPFAFPGSR